MSGEKEFAVYLYFKITNLFVQTGDTVRMEDEDRGSSGILVADQIPAESAARWRSKCSARISV